MDAIFVTDASAEEISALAFALREPVIRFANNSDDSLKNLAAILAKPPQAKDGTDQATPEKLSN